MNQIEKEIEELLGIMEIGPVNSAQILTCSSMLADYDGKNFDVYYQRLIKLGVKG